MVAHRRVERRVNKAEAAVVKEIFRLAAEGWGTRRIAHELNRRGVPAPLPRRAGRPRAWAPSTIYAMLTRPLYRGELVWNQSRKRDAWGRKHQSARVEAEWVRVERPELRIVPESLWQAVERRLKTSRESYLRATNGQLWGRPANGIESRYLLTGLAQCGECGGSLVVHSRPSGGQRRAVYVCSYYHLRGTTVCRNAMTLPLEATNRAVLATLEREVLHPQVAARMIQRLVSELQPQQDTVVPRQTALRAELGVIEQELARLTVALAQGGELPALLDGIKTREQRRRSLQEELAGLDGLRQVSALDLQHLQRQVEARLADYRGLLTRHVAQARQIVKKLLVGRIVFRPVGDGTNEFTGQATVGRILSGLVVTKAVVAPTGFEPVFRP